MIALNNIAGVAQDQTNFYVRVCYSMITKEIEGHISKNSLKKLWILRNEYEWKDYGGPIITYGPTMLYLQSKKNYPETNIGT